MVGKESGQSQLFYKATKVDQPCVAGKIFSRKFDLNIFHHFGESFFLLELKQI
jgi:hypothetical protein